MSDRPVPPPEIDEEARVTVGLTTRSYDRIASAYASNHADSIGEPVAQTRARFREGLEPGAAVADVGCGPGRDLRWFAAQGLNAIGVDSSLEMLRLPVQRDSIRVCADLRRLPFASDSLDGVWCASALLHIRRNEAGDVLRGFHRVLRPAGLLGLITPIGDTEGWELLPYAENTQQYTDPVRRWFAYFQPSELIRLLSEVGFHVQHAETVQRFKPWWHAVLKAAN